jgi:hypothetical protein
MKDIPPNVWRKSLNEDDWNFLQIQNDEWPECLVWELHREKAQAESGGNFPTEPIYEPTVQEHRRFGVRLAGQKRAGIYSKPDWSSYLSGRKKGNWKRIQKSERDTSFWISLDWHTLHRHWGHEVEYAGTHLPFPPIMDGDEETEIVPFRIPWGWRDDEIKSAFSQWLKGNRLIPEPTPPKRLTGAGSYLRQVKKYLKALAAWRLIQHYKGNRIKAYAHPGADKYLGKTYAHASEWTDAKKTVNALLKQIRQISWQAENFASTKLE